MLLLLGLFTCRAVIPLLTIMAAAISTTKIPILLASGFWKMAHEGRTDFSMVVGCLFLLLPFGLLKDLSAIVGGPGVWLTIPFSVLISWIFYTMEQTGEFSENPFDNSINDTPISTICRNIEIDVREILGEDTFPPKLQPENNVLL